METKSVRPKADIDWLFQTEALEVSAPEKPFLYTSGLIGPYYINTHYLCGGKRTALELLSFVDEAQQDKRAFPALIKERLRQIYLNFPIYRHTIEALCSLAEEELPLAEVDYISGGQRRDWFFAPLVARELGKECLYLYNDLSIFGEDGEELTELTGSNVANVSDLLTVGSSYTSKWIPALSRTGATLKWSVSAVDRLQGGETNLQQGGVERVLSLFAINLQLFREAESRRLITPSQFTLIAGYLEDPFASMRSFLRNNPKFLEAALASTDEKSKARARLLVDNDLYKLKETRA